MKSLLLIFFSLLSVAAHVAQPVQFIVHIPADTPAGDSIYLAGSLSAAGGGKPDGVKFSRQADGACTATLDLEIGQTLEFKITRGTWATVEKTADGAERPNRSLSIDASTKRIEVSVERWANGAAARQSTVIGTLKLHKIDSKVLGQSRTIRVWLPSSYDDTADARYPVLYMHDGQNCFDRATSAFGNEWEIDETLTKLIAAKSIPPLIVVGIDNGLGNRMNEYTFVADPARGGGRGADHAQFLLKEVKPFVEKTYRVQNDKAHTLIGGSSLGGLDSLELARRHPDVFGGVLAMSPTIFWADNAVMKAIDKDGSPLKNTRVWLDMGTREGAGDQSDKYVQQTRQLAAALQRQHIIHHLEIEQGAAHNEPAWAERFGRAITWLFKQD
jgi:predicted alpha/beta superfamily hydrolase